MVHATCNAHWHFVRHKPDGISGQKLRSRAVSRVLCVLFYGSFTLPKLEVDWTTGLKVRTNVKEFLE
jgi:hypothetical protein